LFNLVNIFLPWLWLYFNSIMHEEIDEYNVVEAEDINSRGF
jgi:hypothetical protein